MTRRARVVVAALSVAVASAVGVVVAAPFDGWSGVVAYWVAGTVTCLALFAGADGAMGRRRAPPADGER